MSNDELIKRLTGYADAITAFSWVQSVAFCYGIGQDETFVRNVISPHGRWATTAGIVLVNAIYMYLVWRCHAAQETVKDTKASAAHKIDCQIQNGRLAIIGLAGLFSLSALWVSIWKP
jgi:hypothetical protein